MQSRDEQWAGGGGWGNAPPNNLNMPVHHPVHASDGMHGSMQQPAKPWGYDHCHNMATVPHDHANFDANFDMPAQDNESTFRNAQTQQQQTGRQRGVNSASQPQPNNKRPRSATSQEDRPAQSKRGDPVSGSQNTSPSVNGGKDEEKAPEKTWERRERHKAIEQRRRDRTKELLLALQTLLSMNSDPSKPAPNMNDILEAALSALNPQDGGKLAALMRAFRGARSGLQPPRQLAEAADMISLHALDPAGTYIYVNTRCKQMLGFEQEELIGEPAYSLFHPADMKYINESHKMALSEGHCWSVRYRIRKADDGYRWVETASRLTAKGIACCTRAIPDPSDGKPEIINHKQVLGTPDE